MNSLLIPSQRGASNVYFPVIRSAISIPPWINPLYNMIDEHLRDIELARTLMGEEGVTRVYELYFQTYLRSDFDAALERRLNNITEFKEIKQMEYDAITHHNDPSYASNKKHFKAEEEDLPDYLRPYFSRIIRVTRLREVKVLLGCCPFCFRQHPELRFQSRRLLPKREAASQCTHGVSDWTGLP